MAHAIMKAQRTFKGFYSDDDRWQAVILRDPAADGMFFYSVKTTGVYCRPGCPARRPHRKNVCFHATGDAAEAAGFRPCQRCRPTAAGVVQRHAAIVAQACRLIEDAQEAPRLNDLANAVGMSAFHFHRTFKSCTGLTPKRYADAHRTKRLRRELRNSGTITEAIYGAGFNSNSRFYAASTGALGMTPKAYRSGGAGETIRFAVGECRLGSVLVATSEKGICAILLGDDPNKLARDLQDRFANARLTPGNASFDRLVAQVIGFIEAPAIGLDLPLDIRGTAFQRQVWDALRQIPPGSTASYTEIAKRLGQPKSVRAVAKACGANAHAVAIPCHRVVRIDGSLSGYRWGVERKIALLQDEQTVRVPS